jgi:hypothetical protein
MTAKRRQRRSKTTFSCGHPRTPENTRVGRGRGYTWGKCRICNNRYMRAYMRRRALQRRRQLQAARSQAERTSKNVRSDEAEG